jgi:hypothetical protein
MRGICLNLYPDLPDRYCMQSSDWDGSDEVLFGLKSTVYICLIIVANDLFLDRFNRDNIDRIWWGIAH